MNYFVKRGEEKFGPYSLSDLERYVQAGNVSPHDLAQSEGLTDWLPVSEILGTIPVASVSASGAAAAPALEVAPETVPLAPNLHWGILLVLEVLTRNFFNFIWALVLANWARKLSGNNKALVLVAMYPAGFIAGILAFAVTASSSNSSSAILGGVLILAGLIAYLFGIFSIREAMEDYYNSTENIGLQLSGGMTFFFSSVYLQYHINKIARWKRTGVIS